jgi:hypothetical protein
MAFGSHIKAKKDGFQGFLVSTPTGEDGGELGRTGEE